MSMFLYACPVCHQHLKCDASQAGSIMKCPTCYQRVIAPQAPGNAASGLILTGKKYVEKNIPAPGRDARKAKPSVGVGNTVIAVVGGVALFGSAYFGINVLGGGKLVPIANCGFEMPVISAYAYNPGDASWEFTSQNGDSGSGIAVNNDGFTNGNPPAPEGRQVAFLQQHGVITQKVTGFKPGKHYTLTFAAAQRANFPQKGQRWDVRINGNLIKSFAPPQTATDYVIYSAGFTAATIVNTVTFVGTDLNVGDTIFIDNVQIASH